MIGCSVPVPAALTDGGLGYVPLRLFSIGFDDWLISLAALGRG